jgi:hypothetical protein
MFVLYLFVAKKPVDGKRRICGKSSFKIIVTISSNQTGASSDVNMKNDIELSPRQETSDAGYSSGVDNKPKKAMYNYISSDGGLTTDEEKESTSHVATLTVPVVGSKAGNVSVNRIGQSLGGSDLLVCKSAERQR